MARYNAVVLSVYAERTDLVANGNSFDFGAALRF